MCTEFDRIAMDVCTQIEKLYQTCVRARKSLRISNEEMHSLTSRAIAKASDPVAKSLFAKVQPQFVEMARELNEQTFEEWMQGAFTCAKLLRDESFTTAQIQLDDAMIPSAFPMIGQPIEELCCYDYAFLRIGEWRPFCYDFEEAELPQLLETWGYLPIGTKPRPGDLVLFLKDGIPTHLGICREQGLIESKWGNLLPMAYVHRLEDAPLSYGDKIVYYRPPEKRPIFPVDN